MWKRVVRRLAVSWSAWLDRWRGLYTPPSTKTYIRGCAIHQNGQKKARGERGDIQKRAFVERLLGRTNVVKGNEASHKGVWPKQNLTERLHSSPGSEIPKRRGHCSDQNTDAK